MCRLIGVFGWCTWFCKLCLGPVLVSICFILPPPPLPPPPLPPPPLPPRPRPRPLVGMDTGRSPIMIVPSIITLGSSESVFGPSLFIFDLCFDPFMCNWNISSLLAETLHRSQKNSPFASPPLKIWIRCESGVPVITVWNQESVNLQLNLVVSFQICHFLDTCTF